MAGAYLTSASGACVTMRKGLLLGSAIGDCELDVKPLKSEVRSRFVQDGEKGVLVNQPNGIFRRPRCGYIDDGLPRCGTPAFRAQHILRMHACSLVHRTPDCLGWSPWWWLYSSFFRSLRVGEVMFLGGLTRRSRRQRSRVRNIRTLSLVSRTPGSPTSRPRRSQTLSLGCSLVMAR